MKKEVLVNFLTDPLDRKSTLRHVLPPVLNVRNKKKSHILRKSIDYI